MHDHTRGDRVHRIERLAARVAVERANVDTFMEARVNNSRGRLDRVAHETILAAFPRRRFFSFVIALDVLVKSGQIAREKSVVIGR